MTDSGPVLPDRLAGMSDPERGDGDLAGKADVNVEPRPAGAVLVDAGVGREVLGPLERQRQGRRVEVAEDDPGLGRIRRGMRQVDVPDQAGLPGAVQDNLDRGSCPPRVAASQSIGRPLAMY